MKFESIVILKDDMEFEEREKLINKIKDLMKNATCEEWGIKKLAYPVKEHKTGYYVFFDFDVNSKEETQPIEELYMNCEDILRHIIIKK